MFECGAWLGGEWLRTSGKDICIRGSQLRRGLYFYEVPTLNRGHLLVKLWSHDSDRTIYNIAQPTTMLLNIILHCVFV